MTCLTQSALCCLIFPKLPLDQSSMQFKQKVISMSFSMLKKNPLSYTYKYVLTVAAVNVKPMCLF